MSVLHNPCLRIYIEEKKNIPGEWLSLPFIKNVQLVLDYDDRCVDTHGMTTANDCQSICTFNPITMDDV